MDDIAAALNIDPLDIRLLNAFEEGSASPTGQVAAKRRGQGFAAQGGAALRLEGGAVMKRRGRGIACMWYPIGFTVAANPSAAVVKVNEDGTATLLTGTVETGQGSLTVLGQIAAEELGIATDDVHVVSADTDTTPMDTGAIASRTTYVTGNAVRLAAEKAKAILFEVAAPMLGVRPDQLEARDRKIQVKGFPQRNLSIGEVAYHSQVVKGQPPIGSASWNPPTVGMDPETGQGKPFSTYVYATQIAEVDVDDETGEVEVLRIVAAHDCGTAINPMLVEGQVRGRHLDGRGLRAAGGNPVRRRRPADQSQPHQLHHADQPRHAGDRGRYRRQLRSDRTVRRQGRRRADIGADGGGDTECDPQRGGRAHHLAAGDCREGPGGDQGQAFAAAETDFGPLIFRLLVQARLSAGLLS